jgi:hypothetical protein
MSDPRTAIHDLLARKRRCQANFLAELVRNPSDNLPGD